MTARWARRRRLLLSTAALIGGLAASAGSAYAQQVCTDQGGQVFLCDGTSADGQDLTNQDNAAVSTGTGFSVNTATGNALEITGNGALSYVDNNASALTSTFGHGLAITVNGDDGATPGSITIDTNGDIDAQDDGIFASNSGTGSVSVTANGNIEAGTRGIRIENGGIGATELTIGGLVDAAVDGVSVSQTNAGATGDVSVTTAEGSSIDVAKVGIFVDNSGAGATELTVNGDVSGGSASTTVISVHAHATATGNVEITTGPNSLIESTNRSGIVVINEGTGATRLNLFGEVASGPTGSPSAQAVRVQGGPATIVVGGTVRGGVLGGAIAFDQTNVNDDRLELHPGFVITSNAATGSVDTVLAGPGTDTLAFGGSGSGAFDLARIDTGAGTQQYRDFENFEVTGGVWNFSGATTRDFTVAGGTLGGTGTFGAVTVSNGGAIAPGASPGTLYMSSLVLDQTSVLQFELADPVFVGSGVNDFISVSGDVTLDGTIEITALPGFGNGIYQLMEYGNLVADNGIAVDESASPAGYDYQLFVQPQILTVSVTSEMAGGNQFWDGANQTPGNVANGRGGDGVWTRNVGNTNWTSQPGDANAGWAEEFAIFAGAAGTVSIEGPPIEFTGMQFLTSGYRLVTNNVSSELVTETAATNIRVGTGITAEIEAPITGPGGLVKQEGGTLTLSGVNLYTGGTTVAGGTLNIVGSVSGDVLVESGATLAGRTTGLTVTDLGVVTVADGGILAPGPLVVSGTSMQFSSLRLNPGSILEFELGAPTGEVEIRAGGDSLNETVIDGTVNVTALPGFGNGLYPLISFNAPNTTDNGLLLGDMPDGFDYELQRSTVISNIDVISLVVTSEMAGGNQFWDGANQTPGSVANGRGGSGVWSADAGNTNWTDMAGSANTGWAGDFAIFAGTAGTVTVEGPVDFTGMQFVTSGYQLVSGANGELVTDTATTNIRVGTGITTEIGVAISGSGGLAKQEGGTLVLSGANTYTGDTAIDGGVLLVNGSLLGGGDTVVASGATLGGVGTVSGTTVVNAGGTLAPGNSIGALTVANATFATGSIFEVELNDGGNTIGVNSDHLNVTGTATITGGTIHVTPENGTDDGTTYVPGTTYTVLTFATAGAPGGEFDAVTDDYAFLDFVDSYDASNVYLTSSLVGGGAGTCPGGLSFNQNGACGGVLSIGSGGLYMAVVNLSNAEAPGALDRLSGEIHASVQSTLIEDSRFAREAALGRLRMALGAVGADKAGTAERRVNDDVTFWGRGFGSWGDWNGNGNAAGFDRSIGGFFLGGDARVWDTVRLGAFGGYANTGFDADRRHSDGSADSWHVGVYGGASLGNLGLRVGGAWAWHDLELDRSVAFTGFADSPSSSYDARTWQVFAEAGYRIGFEGIAFEPFAGVAHVDLHADGYDERGGQAALSSDSQDMSTTFTTIGLRAETQFQLGGTTARLTGMAGWRHAFGDVRPKAAHAFAGGSEFDVAGVPIARDAAVLDLGAAVDLVENVTLGVSYSGQFGSGFTDHGLDASIVVRF